MGGEYYLTKNYYVVAGTDFFCPLLSLISYFPSTSDESMVSMVFEVDTNVRRTINVPKSSDLIHQIRQRHQQLIQSNNNQPIVNEMNEDYCITGGMIDSDFYLWFSPFGLSADGPVGSVGHTIPSASVERVVQMIDSFLFDRFRAFESRLIDLSSNKKMGLSLLPSTINNNNNNKRIKLWFSSILNDSFNDHQYYTINKDQLIHIRKLIHDSLPINQYP
jgi:hypothetical protein